MPMYGSQCSEYFSNAMPMTDAEAVQLMVFQMCHLIQRYNYVLDCMNFGHPMREMMPACTGSPPMLSQPESAAMFGPPLPPQQYGQGTTQWSPSTQAVNHRRARSFGPVTQASPQRIHRTSEDPQRSPKIPFRSPVKEANQRSLREVFAFIQDKLEYFVRRFVAMDTSHPTDVDVTDLFAQRTCILIGNGPASTHTLKNTDFHGPLVIGLIWHMASVLIFDEGLLHRFPSEYSLAFAEAWALEEKERNNMQDAITHVQLGKLAGNRARIAKQIVKISGFWSDWRVEFSRSITDEMMHALDRAFMPEFRDQVAGQLRDIVQKMFDVAVRMRQECAYFDLHFPKHGDRFASETMVGAHTNGRPWIGTMGRSVVIFAKSPSLTETKLIDGRAARETHYKSECLIRDRASM